MKIGKSIIALVAAGGLAYVTYESGILGPLHGTSSERSTSAAPSVEKAPAVSVVKVVASEFVETVLVTGSLVPREEIMVAPEVEGLKVLKINVDQGDHVKKGDVLATLVSVTLEAQMAQNDAALARSEATIAQAKSQIIESQARLTEAKNSLERAKPLNKEGYLSGSTYDQREAAAKTSAAQLVAAQDGLKAAQAAKAEVEAQRRELDWRFKNADVRAPASGIVSRRGARLGGIATSIGSGEPLFRIIQDGEIELDAEVTEQQIPKLRIGQNAVVKLAGGVEAKGQLRLISPEIDPATRLGRVRVFLGENPALKIGAFGSGIIETATSNGLALPVTAVSSANGESTVLAVNGNKVQRRVVTTGLSAGGLVEIKSGLAEGDSVIARAGSFLRDGDTVQPVPLDSNSTPSGVGTGMAQPKSVSEIR